MTRQYPEINRHQFLARLEPLLTPAEMENVETAYAFSKYAHRGQLRQDGRRYFEHPKAVAWIVVDELGFHDWRLVVLALLHDVLEDAFLLSEHRVQLNFGRPVLVGLKLLSKMPEEGYLERLEAHGDWRVLMVKLSDRLHNLRTLGACSPEKQRRVAEESRRRFVPLLDRLEERVPRAARPGADRLHQLFIDQLALVAA